MAEVLDLTRVSSDALRAELDRRKEAAKAKGRPMKYATKAEWAEARAVELRAQLAEVQTASQPGHVGLRKKTAQQELLLEEIAKFDRLAVSFRRKGQ
ncbi:hypothetical protein CO641_02325 [Lysobacteraceae bacterium NML91-0213]|nr:hypothetical protein CO641_02325 [Xanthomonadaceae bacterium NML91-0213]